MSDLENWLLAALPELRGKLTSGTALADLTWFRVGGPAEILYSPADEADLAYFLKRTPANLPVTVIGLGSNLLVRDGGIAGVVIRLGRGFGEMGTDSVDHRSLLANEQMARAVEHQAALLLGCFGGNEPHVGPGDRFADGLSVCSIVLLPLHIGLHVGRRHQTYRMPQSLELA